MWSTWIERWQQKKFCAAGERCESTLERGSASLPLPQNALYALVVWIEIYREQRRNDVGWDRQNAFHEEVIQTFSCRNESRNAHQKTRRWKLHSELQERVQKIDTLKTKIKASRNGHKNQWNYAEFGGFDKLPSFSWGKQSVRISGRKIYGR